MQEVEKREGRDTMQKEEFEDLVGQKLSDRDYEIIKTVYLYHPAVRDVSGKEEVAELYKSFGMTIFYDMIGRAKKNQDLENQLRHIQAEADRIKEEMVRNRASMGLDYSRMLDKLATPGAEEGKTLRDNVSKAVNISAITKRLRNYTEAILGGGDKPQSPEDLTIVSAMEEEILLLERITRE